MFNLFLNMTSSGVQFFIGASAIVSGCFIAILVLGYMYSKINFKTLLITILASTCFFIYFMEKNFESLKKYSIATLDQGYYVNGVSLMVTKKTNRVVDLSQDQSVLFTQNPDSPIGTLSCKRTMKECIKRLSGVDFNRIPLNGSLIEIIIK